MKKPRKKKPYWKALPEATAEQALAQRERLIKAGIVTPAKEAA